VLDLRADHAEQNHLVMAMLVCGGLGLALAIAAGAWLGTRAVQPLTAALALQRRFVSDASHELRTPLTLLSTRAQMLRRRLLVTGEGVAALDDVEDIVRDSKQLGEILEDLLLAADPVAAQAHELVDLVAVAADVVASAEAAPRQRPVRITGPASGQRVWVRGSPIALRRAVSALTDNAVRHARHSVTVSVTRQGPWVLLDVTDDGAGISPEVAPRILQRFVSTGGATTDGSRHYGLGLALVSEIASVHGGRVEVLQPPGPGAALRLTLPGADP